MGLQENERRVLPDGMDDLHSKKWEESHAPVLREEAYEKKELKITSILLLEDPKLVNFYIFL